MNCGIYRLVFSEERKAWVAVAEWARTRGKSSGSSGKSRGSARRARAVPRCVVATTLLAMVLVAHGRPAVSNMPAPNVVPVPATSRSFVFSGSVSNPGGVPTTANNAAGGRDMRIDTASRTLGLNWDSFNVGSTSSVTFNQPDASSRVLNRIWDASPSVILGKLTANGQVYLINQNGILFGNGAQVNVGGLVASALGISDSLLTKGLPLNVGESMAFSWEGDAAGFARGFVAVDSGAVINASGSPVVLLAPKLVENQGVIRTGTGGEAILAAGGSVFLTVPADPNLRGLLVEVKSWQGVDALGNKATLDGSVVHKSDGSSNPDGSRNGSIVAPTGVVTLAALAVNQEGAISASKAINLNGQIMLVSGSQDTARLTVTQTGAKAEIDWKSGFNVAQGQTVEFIQPTSGAVAYNFVHDADRKLADGSALDQAGRSTIDGVLKANGQLLLINEKGIDFGAHARVSASNFVASALGINPEVVTRGLLAQTAVDYPAFSINRWPDATSSASLENTRPWASVDTANEAMALLREATVNVAAGATINTAANGYAIFAGGRVDQAGTITTPEGQAILAAGARVYLKAPYAQTLRGFTAEVDPVYYKDGDGRFVALSRGADANKVTNRGTISAPFGNITLVGHQIEQAGTLAASTSATRNGSIRLMARDLVSATTKRDVTNGVVGTMESASTTPPPEAFVFGTLGGQLTFAANSLTRVALDGSDGQTITATQELARSVIEASAAKIHVQGASAGAVGAQIVAKSGAIQFNSAAGFNTANALAVDTVTATPDAAPSADAGIFIGAGARLDVSGATAQKSVSDLFIEVELRGDELAGNPVQRFGLLRGQKAWVDVRDKVAIADLTGYFNKVGLTLDEKAATGGSVALRSTGSVIVKRDAVIDVSGGRVAYAAGEVKESKLLTARGAAYRLNDAPSDLRYARLNTVTRQERAYTEGKSAGSVEVAGHSLALDGDLIGKTVRGERQRNIGDPATDRSAIPRGAKLMVRDAGQHYQPTGASEAEKTAAYQQSQIAFVAGAARAAEGLVFGDIARPKLELSQSLVDAGFSRFDIKSDGRIDIPAQVALNLAAGGEFTASGRQVNVDGDITTPGGAISLATRDMSTAGGLFPAEGKYSILTINDGAMLSTAGQWVNDLLVTHPSGYAPKAIQGGSISLASAYDLDVKAGAALDVSGGARLYRSGSKEKLEAGNAGSIKLKSGAFGIAGSDERFTSSVFLDGRLSGFSLANGGRLEIGSSRVRLGAARPDGLRELMSAQRATGDQYGAYIGADFLAQGGFLQFKFVSGGNLDVIDGTLLRPDPLSWSLAAVRGYQTLPTASPIASFADSVRLHPELRAAPSSLTLEAGGNLRIGEQARLVVDPQGSIDVSTKSISSQMTVLGALEAPAGSIRLARTPPEVLGYERANQSHSIYLGPNSRLLAAGVTRLDTATRTALDAGLSAVALHALGRYQGQVLGGGSVTVDAGSGYLVTRPGSLIDVGGAADVLDMPTAGRRLTYQPTAVGSAGGRVSFSAREGMFLNGDYRAAGGGGTPGGIFSVRLGYGKEWDFSNTADPDIDYVTAPRLLTLHQSAGSRPDNWPAGVSGSAYLAGTEILDPALFNGKARLDLTPLTAGGFGSWYLHSQGQIGFDGAINASVANQMRLDSQSFAASPGANIALRAAAMQIGSYDTQTAATPTTGNATFRAEARDLALVGKFSWSGFDTTTLASRGELHFDSVADGKGLMKGTGAVKFSAARLSPATFSNFTVDFSADPAGRIDITRPANAESLGPLLAAGGRLEFKAHEIVHRGRIDAPLGQVVFTAPGGSVTLGAESITSVAASSLLPLGLTEQSGKDWKFAPSYWSNGTLVNGFLNVGVPEKAVRVDAANSKVETGATIDLSGGGEAVAWEFTPGPGGKADVLAQIEGREPTTFAILPGWSGNFAPSDSQNQAYYNVSNPQKNADGFSYTYDAIPSLKPGDQISLGANPSGFTGLFTLLPARYALLPGAVLVTAKPTQDGTVATALPQTDGSWLVAGTKLAANADGSYSSYSQRALTFELAPQSVVVQRAKYLATTATGRYFDTPGVQLPGDAGRLSVAGRTSLSFDPVVLGRREFVVAEDGRSRVGRGIELDLAAPKMEVVEAGATGSGLGWTNFSKQHLNGLGVSSLLLGGLRTVDGNMATIETVATDVRIATSGADLARDALQAPEILLAATDKATIETGSLVAANGDASARDFVLEGDGAFARIAGGAQANLTRTGGVTRNQGDLALKAGARISGRALIFDATHANTLAGTISLNNIGQSAAIGGALAIGAPRINIVGDGSTAADGLTLDNLHLAAFGSPDQLRLTSYSTLDFYGPATLGSIGLKDMTIAAAGIAGHGAAAETATILAERVRFENPNPDTATFIAGRRDGEAVDAPLGSGTLDVKAQSIVFGDNATAANRSSEQAGFAVRGFDGVKLNASNEVRLAGTGVTKFDNDASLRGTGVATNLTIDAGRVVVAGGADHLIQASGASAIKGGGNTAAVGDLGGRLDLRADSVDVSGRLVAPAGSIALTATGAGKHVTIKGGGVVAAEGTAVAFADTLAYAPGGKISLKSESGNVAVDSGAIVSVSGGPGGDAGRLALIARNGMVSAAAGTLRGTASAADPGLRQAELSVDANAVDINGLAAAVREPVAGGDPKTHFTGQWDIRRRNGDIALTDTVTAQRVRFAADNGSVRIGDGAAGTGAGKIDASGPKGGEIELYARNGTVNLSANSQLLATANEKIESAANVGTRGRGGRVTFGASGAGGKVVTEVGSLIAVGAAEGSAAQGGKVVFRAPKSGSIADKTDLNIQLAGAIQGASDVSAEIVSAYTGTALNAGTTSGSTLGLTTIKNELNTLYSAANMTTLRNHLGFSDAIYHVRPGVDITTPAGSTSDFTISADLDFNALRFQGEAGFLTIRAPRDLKISGSISDGFANATRDAALNSSGDAWSYRLAAGADTTAANPLAVVAAPAAGTTATSDPLALKGSIEVAANKFVRTGAGDIALAARRDIKLLDKASVFTAGRADTSHPANFTASSFSFGGTTYRPSFPVGGGNMTLAAGERIVMVKSGETAPDKRHVNEWLLRGSSTSVNTQWGPRIASFQQGFAAFGGGDIRLLAGTDIKNVTVAIPTSGRVPGQPGQVELAKIEGGGDLTARAGSSVEGGLFYAETGRLRIEAGKEVKSDTAIALGNTEATVVAGSGAALGAVFNPLWVKQAYVNSSGASSGYAQDTFSMRIGTYGEDSKLNLTSLTGNAALSGTDTYGRISDAMMRMAPRRVRIAAVGGDITGSVAQAPGTDGQIDLLASGSIKLGNNGIQQIDVPASYLPSIGTPKPGADNGAYSLMLKGLLPASIQHASTPWHQNDYEPSRLIALNGDITGVRDLTNISRFNEAVRIEAAGDISNLNLAIQHTRPKDVSRIHAGGNIIYGTEKVQGTFSSQGVRIQGAGRLEMTAAGSIDLGNSGGIVSRGNLDNFYLPEGGADILLLAGATPDYAGFRTFLGVGAELGDNVLRSHFYDLLREKGRNALAGGGEASYEQGRAAIRALFPTASVTGGDIAMAYSQVKTEQGGGIDFLAPGGGITVGIAATDKDLVKFQGAGDQGVFTVRGGDIRALVRDDFLVNQSRVFTLDGGNILVWADKGGIDAGSGAKTVSATPPPTLIVRNGQIVLDTSNSVSGSGIGVLASRPDTSASDLDLFAPQGAIDAGDAGLRSTGNVNLGAKVILNASNIQAAGSVTGAPAAATVAPPVAAPTNPVADANSSAGNPMQIAAAGTVNSLLTVEVLGMGDGASSAEDTAESDLTEDDADTADEKKKKKRNRPL